MITECDEDKGGYDDEHASTEPSAASRQRRAVVPNMVNATMPPTENAFTMNLMLTTSGPPNTTGENAVQGAANTTSSDEKMIGDNETQEDDEVKSEQCAEEAWRSQLKVANPARQFVTDIIIRSWVRS